jgi:hypothetical protein
MIMKKVDRDLQDTLTAVRDTFQALTNQVSALVKEVEEGRRQVKAIQDQYTIAKQHAETQAQYVLELEAVLDGQGGISSTLSSEKPERPGTGGKRAVSPRESPEVNMHLRALQMENRKLKAQLKRVQRLDAGAQECAGAQSPPLLPEMASTWTRRTARTPVPRAATSSPIQSCMSPPPSAGQSNILASFELDIVGSILNKSDAHRAVSRTKAEWLPEREKWVLEGHPLRSGEARKRTDVIAARLAAFSAVAASLMRGLFDELRSSFGNNLGHEGFSPLKAPEVLGRIVRLCYAAAPELSAFPDVVGELGMQTSTTMCPTGNSSGVGGGERARSET